jgi:hypothetical protein
VSTTLLVLIKATGFWKASMNTKLLVLAPALLLSGCVVDSSAYYGDAASSAPEAVPAHVYFYPTQGQSPERQERDRYECYNWAVSRTGFDPSRRPLPPSQRDVVVPARPTGEATVGGALIGAIIGAAVSDSRNAASGALVGAAAGGLLGAVSESAQADEDARRYTASQAAAAAGNGRAAADYQRAMSACLEARGYSVK